MADDTPALLVIRIEALSATRARNDEELVASWLDSLRSGHSRPEAATRSPAQRSTMSSKISIG